MHSSLEELHFLVVHHIKFMISQSLVKYIKSMKKYLDSSIPFKCFSWLWRILTTISLLFPTTLLILLVYRLSVKRSCYKVKSRHQFSADMIQKLKDDWRQQYFEGLNYFSNSQVFLILKYKNYIQNQYAKIYGLNQIWSDIQSDHG